MPTPPFRPSLAPLPLLLSSIDDLAVPEFVPPAPVLACMEPMLGSAKQNITVRCMCMCEREREIERESA